ncbi:MAG TPA: hypothetical protein PLE30_02965 [Candidatus Kapabacteria bacterium]|nr:hypothetical protein [Candidatus Kapabacteria bacterium]
MKIFNIFILIVLCAINLNAADWSKTSGPKDGSIYLGTYCLQHVSDNTIVAGTMANGVFKTTNSGNSWTNVKSLSTTSYCLSKSSNGYLFLGTDGDGVYRSTDNGNNWTKVLSCQGVVWDISSAGSSNIYACSEIDGVYHSTDNGATWSLLWETEMIPISVYANGNDIYVGTMIDGLYYSDDGGLNFNFLDFSGDVVWDIATNQDSIIVCTEMGGVNYSTDGATFTNFGFPNSGVSRFYQFSNGKQYLIATNMVYVYDPIENLWESYNDGLGINSASDIEEDSEGYLLVSTLGDGVYKTSTSILEPEILSLSDANSEYCAGEYFTIDYTARGAFAGTNNFTIQLSDADGDFTNPIIIGTVQAQKSGSIDVVIPFDTPQGANHHYRIVSSQPVITGPSSTSFVVNELSTSLNSPANFATDVSVKPTFSWEANDCAVNYTLQVSTESDFSTIDYQFASLSTNSYTMLVELNTNTTYYWRVILQSLLGDELYTDYNEFLTTANALDNQTIYLKAGWNIISSYITNESMNVANYLGSIASNITIVKNATGKVYIPEFNINTINNWNINSSYRFFMKNADTLELSGEAIVPENNTINLSAGWNMLSYLRNSPMNIITALQQLTDNSNLVIAKNAKGQTYIPAFGINTIGDMLPGQGYLIYVTNVDAFTYPAN